MKSKIVTVKNVARLAEAGEALMRRDPDLPGMALVDGDTGVGKTKTITWYHNTCNGVYVRAMRVWSPQSMLQKISSRLGLAARGSCAAMADDIAGMLTISQRPLFMDEIDEIVQGRRADDLLETLRDIHDLSGAPIVLVGETGIAQKIAHLRRLTGRMLYEVHFEPQDDADAERLAKELCRVDIQPALVHHLNRQAGGLTRLILVGLHRITSYASARGKTAVTLEEWGRRKLFTGEGPKSSRGAQ